VQNVRVNSSAVNVCLRRRAGYGRSSVAGTQISSGAKGLFGHGGLRKDGVDGTVLLQAFQSHGYRPRLAEYWQGTRENCLWGAPRIHGELLRLGIAVSERTVSRYLPDRTRGRSQTWRTFLTNHVGELMCSSAVASSELPGEDDVVDTSLFSFGVTPASGTSGRLQPRGDYQLRSFGSTHVPSLAGFQGPAFTAGLGQASSGRDTAKVMAGATGTHTRGDSFVRRCRFCGTDRLRRLVRHATWIAIGQFGDCSCAATPSMWPHGRHVALEARVRSVLMSQRNFGEAQGRAAPRDRDTRQNAALFILDIAAKASF
jgi:hypothetical protein